MTFLCGYAMIMAYKYGGRPECAFCAARYRHGTTTKRSPRGVRSGPTGARLFRYLGRNAARMPFFRLKAVRRRVRVDPICQKSIGYRLPMDDWRGARGVRGSVAWNTANVFVSEEKKLSGAICFAPPYLWYAPGVSATRSRGAAAASDEWRNDSSDGARRPVDGAMSQRTAPSEVYLIIGDGFTDGEITRGGTNPIPQVRADSGVCTVRTAGVSGMGANAKVPKTSRRKVI